MKNIIIICFLLCLGCGSLHKNKFLSKSEAKHQLSKSDKETTSSNKYITIKDSSDSKLAFIIWPKGEFVYNSINGFKGEAFKLEVRAKHRQVVQSNEQTSAKSERSAKFKVQQQNVAKLKEKAVVWKNLNYGIGIFILLMVVIAIWYLRKKLPSLF